MTTVAIPAPTVATLPAATAELPVATEALPPATQVSSTVATTLPATTAPVTSNPGTPDCRLDVIVEQTETSFDGMKPGGLRCAGPWATWSGTPLDPNASDPYFAVALWRNGSWILADLGTAGVCEGAGVPADLWPSLDCTE